MPIILRPMLLIDTYNVLMVDGVLPQHLAGLDVAGLATLLSLSRYSRQETYLICDGVGPRGRAGEPVGARFTVRYSGTGATADDLILSILAGYSGGREAILVSSDRALRRAARRHKVKSIQSDDFLRELVLDESRGGRRAGHKKPEVPLDRGLVARWMEEFGYSYDPAHRPPQPTDTLQPTLKPKVVPRSAVAPPKPSSHPVTDDPLLAEALEVWAGRLHMSDLDMNRWLAREFNPDQDKPNPGPPRSSRRPR
jgi:hypothetical protein